MIDKQVSVSNGTDYLSVAHLRGKIENAKCTLTITNEDLDITANEEDYFECLLKLRTQLEKSGLFILCMGSAIDVRPSAMSRSMGNGILAYRHRFDTPSTSEDRVDIFDPIDFKDVSTVARQETFYESWIQSLRMRS